MSRSETRTISSFPPFHFLVTMRTFFESICTCNLKQAHELREFHELNAEASASSQESWSPLRGQPRTAQWRPRSSSSCEGETTHETTATRFRSLSCYCFIRDTNQAANLICKNPSSFRHGLLGLLLVDAPRLSKGNSVVKASHIVLAPKSPIGNVITFAPCRWMHSTSGG